MNLSSKNFKLIVGAIYLSILFIGLFFLFSYMDIKDLTSYEFIRSNKNLILEYKNNNFILLTISFFIFCVIWVLLLGFGMPILLFSGFIFGKWWGIIIIIFSTTIGATLLYLLASLFFKDFIEDKLAPKFSSLKEIFKKNELIYFTIYRFVGGGGTPYGIQNVLPVLFDMKIKNYILGTFFGSLPAMFVTVSLGSGIEQVIDKNEELSFTTVLVSPEIYIPLIGFFIILILALMIKKKFFYKG
tara:strand:- start:1583 stop:2311 length:729 start_codon:yes stop_codon:yes gene_type:complete